MSITYPPQSLKFGPYQVTMSRAGSATGAATRLMSEMKALRKEKWINFEDVRSFSDAQRHDACMLGKAQN